MSDERQALRERIAAHVAHAGNANVEVRALEPLPGGACQENWVVELDLGNTEDESRRFVLRSDALTSLPGSLDRAAEFKVVTIAAAAGVRTPMASWPAIGLVKEGRGSYFLDWAEGEAIGRRIVSNPKLAEARARLPAELAIELAKIHSITPNQHPDLFPADRGANANRSPARASLDRLWQMLNEFPEPRPAIELALSWLEANIPDKEEIVLCHGDFRTGNFLVTPAGLSAILDWEFARWSSPAEDLAWISVRDWRFGVLDKPIGGFSARAPFYEAYAKASGRDVPRAHIHYWEVLGNMSWALGSLHQGERYLRGDEDIELIAIARRGVEMEWEALRLIERGH